MTPYRYIAIEGNIGAGKTSLSTKLAGDLQGRLLLEEFADNPFLPKFYENRERYSFPLELSFLAERYSQLKDELNSLDLFQKIIFSDYFINKSLIFAKANLQGAEFELFSKMYQIIEQNLPKPDLLVYLYLPVNKLLNNIKNRGRDYEKSISEDYLMEVHDSYLKFISQHRNQRILILNTENLDFVNNEEDYQAIKKCVLAEYPLGITRLEF